MAILFCKSDKGAGKVSGRGLFKDFQTFLLVNNHPKCLNIQTDNRDQRIEKEEINRFLCDEDEEEESGDEEFDEDKLDQMEDTVKVFISSVISRYNMSLGSNIYF